MPVVYNAEAVRSSESFGAVIYHICPWLSVADLQKMSIPGRADSVVSVDGGSGTSNGAGPGGASGGGGAGCGAASGGGGAGVVSLLPVGPGPVRVAEAQVAVPAAPEAVPAAPVAVPAPVAVQAPVAAPAQVAVQVR